MKKIILFKKPKFLRPEINELAYWVHIIIVLGIMFGLNSFHDPGTNYLIWGLHLVIGDIVAHSILGFD